MTYRLQTNNRGYADVSITKRNSFGDFDVRIDWYRQGGLHVKTKTFIQSGKNDEETIKDAKDNVNEEIMRNTLI